MIAAILVVLAASGTQTRPVPFGIPMGTPIARLKNAQPFGTKYFDVSPPVRNPAFESYSVTATPKHGVCGVHAATETIPDLAEAASKLKEISKLLIIYGHPDLTEIPSNLPWHQFKGNIDDYRERYWNKNLPNHIRSIFLRISGNDGLYKILISYYYDNMSKCHYWGPNQNRSGL